MSRAQDGAKHDDLLYDQFSEKDDLWFDFVADTGDGGNSSYSGTSSCSTFDSCPF